MLRMVLPAVSAVCIMSSALMQARRRAGALACSSWCCEREICRCARPPRAKLEIASETRRFARTAQPRRTDLQALRERDLQVEVRAARCAVRGGSRGAHPGAAVAVFSCALCAWSLVLQKHVEGKDEASLSRRGATQIRVRARCSSASGALQRLVRDASCAVPRCCLAAAAALWGFAEDDGAVKDALDTGLQPHWPALRMTGAKTQGATTGRACWCASCWAWGCARRRVPRTLGRCPLHPSPRRTV